MFHQKADETCTATPLDMERIVDEYGNSLFRDVLFIFKRYSTCRRCCTRYVYQSVSELQL